MTSSATKLRLASISLLLIALLGMLGFALFKLKTESAETARLTRLAEELEKREDTARIVRGLRESSKEDIDAFEGLASSTETLVSTIEDIEEAGRSLGLSTEIASVEREGENDSSQNVKIIVESSGSWKGNFSLLKSLENLPQRVSIGSVYFTKGEAGWRSSIELTLSSL